MSYSACQIGPSVSYWPAHAASRRCSLSSCFVFLVVFAVLQGTRCTNTALTRVCVVLEANERVFAHRLLLQLHQSGVPASGASEPASSKAFVASSQALFEPGLNRHGNGFSERAMPRDFVLTAYRLISQIISRYFTCWPVCAHLSGIVCGHYSYIDRVCRSGLARDCTSILAMQKAAHRSHKYYVQGWLQRIEGYIGCGTGCTWCPSQFSIYLFLFVWHVIELVFPSLQDSN
jgi:hypothetical protein